LPTYPEKIRGSLVGILEKEIKCNYQIFSRPAYSFVTNYQVKCRLGE
jgi:hypothetical protein